VNHRNLKPLFSLPFNHLLLAGLIIASAAFFQTTASASDVLRPDPGPAVANVSGTKFSLRNRALRAGWTVDSKHVQPAEFEDLLGKHSLKLPGELFLVEIKNGAELRSTQMTVTAPPKVEEIAGIPNASRESDRLPGKRIVVTLQSSPAHLDVLWAAILRDGSNYLRQEITLRAKDEDVPIADVRLINWKMPQLQVVGTVAGSPVTTDSVFAGFENPLSNCSVSSGIATCALARELPLRAGHEVTYSSVIGVAPPQQMRRAFLNYVERERAHPYRTFLHYNTWYDLGYFNRYDEAGVLDRIQAFGTELHKKRNVTLDSFLFDDGWDNPKTLWTFNPGFPRGLTTFAEAAANYGVLPGIWMSPWGGYGKPHDERIKFGKEQGFETNKEGFELSGPKYYSYFREVCFEMIRKYGVNQFKFDGTGNVNEVISGSQFDSDFDAAIHLIEDLRSTKPDIYINLTTGTYPSPFWLRYADSIWRGGDDHDFAGVGPWRQKWITYRDADTYEHIVKAGPLYPLNSLMLHGLIYAQHAKNLGTDPGNDFTAEIHDYFGTGTQLQEMYVTPSLLSKENWDTLAETANWSRRNASILRDTHWIGGDPAKLGVYGWASWSPEKAILVLRNPSDKATDFSIDVGPAFEIPHGSPTEFQAKSPWAHDSSTIPIRLRAGTAHKFHLGPFEVLTLEATPVLR
jgi:hypothetical protein